MTKLRLLIPAIFFALWAGAVVFRHFQLAGPRREAVLQQGTRLSLIQRTYPPVRGRLLDAGGTPLAWSERYFDLEWHEEIAPGQQTLTELSGFLGFRLEPEPAEADRKWILKRDLLPMELLKANQILSQHPSLVIRPRLERIRVNIEDLREKIGKTELRHGELVGVSGWEAEYDELLRGVPGKFEVLLDRRRQWIDSSWKLLQKAVPGRDVRVPYQLEETGM